jgi:hypothetical protein
MDFTHSTRWQGVEIGHGVSPKIATAHVDVVDIAQESTARPPHQLLQKLGLGDGGVSETQVTRRVLDEEAALQDLLGVHYMLGDDLEGLLRIGQGKEMVEIDTSCDTPGEMLRHKRRFEPCYEPLQTRQMTVIERFSAPERQSHSMQREWVVGSESLQRSERGTFTHIVLSMHLEPADGWTRRQHLRDVRRTQPDPHA